MNKSALAMAGFGFAALHVKALQSAGIDPNNIRKGERLTERSGPATLAGRAEDEGEMNEPGAEWSQWLLVFGGVARHDDHCLYRDDLPR
jgi:hypothetical protein